MGLSEEERTVEGCSRVGLAKDSDGLGESDRLRERESDEFRNSGEIGGVRTADMAKTCYSR